MTSTPTGARQQHGPSATARLRMPPHRSGDTGSLRRLRQSLPRYDYEHYSRLAGPLTQPDPDRPYRVRYRSLLSQEPHRVRVALMLCAAPLLSLVLLGWLLQPDHWTERRYPQYGFLPALDIVMLVSIGLIEFFRCVNVLSNAHATLVARDPVPVVPEAGTRVAFLTTYVPGKEPLEMVTKTLQAAVRLRHRGVITTPGWRRTATSTTSSPPSTPTTCRCPTTWSGCSATSATRTSASSSARRSTATTRPSSPRPPSRSSSSSTP
jgi:hypothetical protein